MAQSQAFRKVAIITGGASGIGRGLAEELAQRGFEVVVADRQAELAQEVAASIRGRGQIAHAAEVDVRSFDSIRQVVEATMARSGRLDYLFNNAGIVITRMSESYTLTDWDDVFDVNLRGVAYGVQAAYPIMIAQGFGHIINTASMAGLVASAGHISYTASKFAVVGLSKALRAEAAHHGVRVSVLCPGAIRTPILKGGRYGQRHAESLSLEAIDRYVERLRPIAPDQFARKAIDAVLRNAAVIVVPSWWKLLWYMERFFPALAFRLSVRALKKARQEIARERALGPGPHETATEDRHA